jgi:hypothetical protein
MIVVCDTFNPFDLFHCYFIYLHLLINFGVSCFSSFKVVFNMLWAHVKQKKKH